MIRQVFSFSGIYHQGICDAKREKEKPTAYLFPDYLPPGYDWVAI